MSSHYPSLASYTADVERARRAYRADMAVLNGLCAVCQTNPRGTTRRHRRCGMCEGKRRKEGLR